LGTIARGLDGKGEFASRRGPHSTFCVPKLIMSYNQFAIYLTRPAKQAAGKRENAQAEAA
jgi:hypothetical protein